MEVRSEPYARSFLGEALCSADPKNTIYTELQMISLKTANQGAVQRHRASETLRGLPRHSWHFSDYLYFTALDSLDVRPPYFALIGPRCAPRQSPFTAIFLQPYLVNMNALLYHLRYVNPIFGDQSVSKIWSLNGKKRRYPDYGHLVRKRNRLIRAFLYG